METVFIVLWSRDIDEWQVMSTHATREGAVEATYKYERQNPDRSRAGYDIIEMELEQ